MYKTLRMCDWEGTTGQGCQGHVKMLKSQGMQRLPPGVTWYPAYEAVPVSRPKDIKLFLPRVTGGKAEKALGFSSDTGVLIRCVTLDISSF